MDICDELTGICFIIMLHDLDIQFFHLYQTLPKLENIGGWAWVNIKGVPDSWPRTLHQIFLMQYRCCQVKEQKKSVITSTGGRAGRGWQQLNWEGCMESTERRERERIELALGEQQGAEDCLLFTPRINIPGTRRIFSVLFNSFSHYITFTFQVSSVTNNPLDIKMSHS